MAIIVDTNCLSHVFNRKDEKHEIFKPVLDWIIYGHGFIVYGGTKYNEELSLCKKYLKLFILLKSIGKAIEFRDKCQLIDSITKRLEEKYGNKDFDDPHLPAIAQVTKCRIICSTDTRSIGYVRNSKMYPKYYSLPIYYTKIEDKVILIDRNIDERLLCYRKNLNKSLKQFFESAVDNIDNYTF